MIDLRPVFHIIGWLTAFLGGLMLLPLVLDLVDGHPTASGFAVSALLAITAGTSIAIVCADGRQQALTLRQGVLLTTCAWMALAGMSSIPLMLAIPNLAATDAIFETMSAMTTTGATVLSGLETMPRGVLLWRGLLQWIGGIGVVLMAIILLPVLRVGGMQLARTADFNTIEKIMPRVKDIAASFGTVYVALTFACAVGYVWSGMSTFDASVHAMTTIATGGMGNYDTSFGAFSPAAQYVSTGFMLIGGMSFVRYVQILQGRTGPLFTDAQIRGFLGFYLALCLGVLFARLLSGEALNETVLRQVLFNLASILTTTGYASTDYTLWGSLAVVLVFCAGMVCGCSGSTSGGPKVFRYQLLLSEIRAQIRRIHSPNSVVSQTYQGQRLTAEVMNSVMAFFMLFFVSLAVGSVLLVLLGLDLVTAVSGAATCLSNIGPGLGPVIGPAGNFAGLPRPAKWVMVFLMLAGRLELMTFYVLFVGAFWRD